MLIGITKVKMGKFGLHICNVPRSPRAGVGTGLSNTPRGAANGTARLLEKRTSPYLKEARSGSVCPRHSYTLGLFYNLYLRNRVTPESNHADRSEAGSAFGNGRSSRADL